MVQVASSKKATVCFDCTRCGACCRDTIIPLTLDEALAWGTLSHDPKQPPMVGLSAQILFWDPQDEQRLADTMPPEVIEWWRQRTMAGRCGRMKVRVSLRLYAVISGPCPHLDGLLCGAHSRRPSVCAAYPLEVNEPPTSEIVHPEATACPPEAWHGSTALVSNGRPLDGSENEAFKHYQAAWAAEQALLGHMRDIVGLDVGAMPSDCDVVVPIAHTALVAAAAEGRRRHAMGDTSPGRWWKIFTLDNKTQRLMKRHGAFVAAEAPPGAAIVPGLLWRGENGAVRTR